MILEKEKTRISKFLSLVLRHQPELIGLQLDHAGWADVDSLIEKVNRYGISLDLSALREIVETNDKKRFAFNETGDMIRASQGHSLEVDLQYQEQSPPEILYHGTGEKYLDSIMSTGLTKQKRHHVHLSADRLTALKWGSVMENPPCWWSARQKCIS